MFVDRFNMDWNSYSRANTIACIESLRSTFTQYAWSLVFHPQHHIDMVWWYMPTTPLLRWQRQRDQKVKVAP